MKIKLVVSAQISTDEIFSCLGCFANIIVYIHYYAYYTYVCIIEMLCQRVSHNASFRIPMRAQSMIIINKSLTG